jgi:hypothetical protein
MNPTRNTLPKLWLEYKLGKGVGEGIAGVNTLGNPERKRRREREA